MSVAPLVFALIFIGVFLAVEGLYLLAFGRSARRNAKVNRRLMMLEKGDDPLEVLSQLRKERERHVNASGTPLLAGIFEKAAQANIPWSPRTIMMLTGTAAGAVFVALMVFTNLGPLVSAPVALAMAFGVMFFWVNGRAKKRLARFEEQLPEAIELMVRALRIGHPFSSAVSIVAKEMDDPIGTEFGIIADEAIYGLDVNESLERMAERIAVPDLRFLAMAVSIQSQSGGNLAEILAGLAAVVRSRFKLFRRVNAITAESRWSGWFLSAFPILALIAVQLIRPDYYDGVVDSPFFVPATIAVGVMLAINIVFMRMMVNIKV
ncbi:type II secretion system F family protein [Albimonas sp. CAU 1670]|uniref:type II secretion system F family protein n=1 Tax=Albimonas sp. CAU 1670 TaxID=3032599 RepID=UPI0023DAF527|nr:type II secretion system F family protein [Albimonas sp. CAU 1670]MDF2234426.1 type II secretion system F family protein [Albimonas sp. CAU 1670]